MKMEEEFYRQRLLNEYMRSILSASSSSPNGGSGGAAAGESLVRVPGNSWSEREWDQFFRRLEERYDAVDVLPDYKAVLTRRFLRGPQLYNWIEISNAAGAGDSTKSYESIRDDFIKSYFPSSDLYQSMLKVLQAPVDRTPGGATESEGGATTDGGTTTTKPPRRAPNASLNVVRSRAQSYKETMQRVAARTGQEMPEEKLWISWATSLMRPSLYEAYLALENPPNTLADLLAVLVDPQAKETTSENRRHSGRKYRRQKAAAAAAAAAAATAPPTNGKTTGPPPAAAATAATSPAKEQQPPTAAA